MLIIKRYLNRKLYDTQARQYITLERIANLIRQGVQVRVVDHESGEDLTAITLAQVITEQEKKRSGSVPSTALADLIASGAEQRNTLLDLNSDQIEQILKNSNFPTRGEIQSLLSQLDDLNAELDKLARS